MGLLIFFFLVSILFSFLCSVWESVLLSITPAYITRQESDNPKFGARLKKMKDDIDRPLSAILTLNTIAHTAGAIGVGAQAGYLFGNESLHFLGISMHPESIIAGLMTLAILILSEIIPKTIGANLWKQLAPVTVRSVEILTIILSPFVWMSQGITRKLKKDKSRSVLSRADFVAITKIIGKSGGLKKNESTIINNLLELDELHASDIMTPRTVMVMGEESKTLKEFYDEHLVLRVSRIPLYKEDQDHVTGLILKDELLEEIIEGKGDKRLEEIKKPIKVVEEDMTLPALFQNLTAQRTQMAVVVDAYGSLTGLVTMEDLIETLLGLEIVDEYDSIADLQKYARDKWQERASKLGILPKEEAKEENGVKSPNNGDS